MPINTGGSYNGQDDEDDGPSGSPSGSPSPAASGSGTGRGPSTSGTGGGPSTSGTGGGPSTSGSSNGGYGGDFGGSGNFGGGIMGGDWGGVGSNEGIGSLGGDWGGSDHNWSGDFGGIGSAGGFGQLGPDVGGLGQDIGNGGGAPKGDFGAGADPRDFAMNHIMESMGVSLMDNANANAFSAMPNFNKSLGSYEQQPMSYGGNFQNLGGSPSALAEQSLANMPERGSTIAQNNQGAQALGGETGMYADPAYGQVPATGNNLAAQGYQNPNPQSAPVAQPQYSLPGDSVNPVAPQNIQPSQFNAPVMQGQEIDLTQGAANAAGYDPNSGAVQPGMGIMGQPTSKSPADQPTDADLSGSGGTNRGFPDNPIAQALAGDPQNLVSPGFFQNSQGRPYQSGDPGAQRIARALGYKPPTTKKKTAADKKKRSGIMDWNVTYSPLHRRMA